MPIQFENTFVNPNIQVKGTEIPLEQLEKTSNILQDRYDKSYENLTKFQEFAKQAEQNAAEQERGKVKDWVSGFQPQVEQMVKDDALHRVGWKTMAMAQNAAANLKTFQERAVQIKDIQDKIATSEKLGNEVTKKYYQDLLNETVAQTQFDPTKNTFAFKQIIAPKIVADADVNEAYKKYAMGWIADKYGSESANMSFVDKGQSIPGVGGTAVQSGVYNTKTGRIIEKVDRKEVLKGIQSMIEQDIPVQAMIQRDTDIFMKNNPGSDRAKVYAEVKKNTLNAAANAWADKASYISDIRSEDVKFDGDATANYLSGSGQPDPNPNNLLGMPNEVIATKSIDAVKKETAKFNKEAFDKNGNFIGVSPGITDYLTEAAARGALGLMGRIGLGDYAGKMLTTKSSFDEIVPTWAQKRYQARGLNQQQMFNEFQKEKENATRVATVDYVVGDKGRREVVEANMRAALMNNKFYKPNGDVATQEEIQEAFKAGGITMVPYTGKISVGTNDKTGGLKLTTTLGTVADGANTDKNNYSQIRMKAGQTVIEGLLDPTKPTTYTIGSEILYQDPNTGNTLGVYRYVVNKQGAKTQPRKVGDKMVYAESPGRVTKLFIDNNGNRQVVKEYMLGDGNNPTEVITDILNEVVDPYILK
jgi:hypothetical protein